jgi:Zn-dependent peptidase ImmA (M78 family)
MRQEVAIQPDMITWAIARAGFDLKDFIATKLPNVQEWLDDKKKPTVKQLEDFSRKVYLPFGYLLLQEPPVEPPLIPFFRTGKNISEQISLNVRDTILILQKRQSWLREYLQEIETEPLPFVGKFDLKNDHFEIATDIRRVLGLSEDWAGKFPTWEKAKAHLSTQIEEAGIILNFNSVVENNNHRKILVNECRGFVLVDEYAPFLFVNAADAKAAQMFTMVHELAHVWTGKSAAFDFQGLLPANDPLEQLCDRVAAEFLVPETLFIQFWQTNPSVWEAAKKFKVSPIVAARRALDLGKMEKSQFFSFYRSQQAKQQERKSQQKGGGDFYLTQKARLGLRFMAHLTQAVRTNKLLYRDAYKLSGMSGDTFQNFITQNF